MRDENKLREKIELSLDNRQVVSLVIGSLVALGLVFVLGVMVGKQLAPQGEAAPKDLLTALDSKAAPAVPDAGTVALTFQQELTRPVAPAPLKVPEARTAKPADRPAVKLEPRPLDAKPVEPDAPEDKPAPVLAAVATPKPAPVPAEPPAPSPGMDKKLSDAFSAARKEQPAKAPVPAVVAPSSGFTVQVAASQQRDEADSVLQKLRGAGLRPYLVDAEIPGKGHWYRVRLGAFKTRDDAEKYVHDLKRETGFTAFVTAAAK